MKLPRYDVDRDLINRVGERGAPVFRLRPFSGKALVAGRGSRVEEEIRMDRALGDGIPVYRRPGGGCSVFLDPGNITVSLAFPFPGIGQIPEIFECCTTWLVTGLADIGISGVRRKGISDLVLEDRKIAGSCLFRTRGMAYFASSLLVAPDLELMERYLLHPPREPDYRRGRTHRKFVAGLDRWMPGVNAVYLTSQLDAALSPMVNPFVLPR